MYQKCYHLCRFHFVLQFPHLAHRLRFKEQPSVSGDFSPQKFKRWKDVAFQSPHPVFCGKQCSVIGNITPVAFDDQCLQQISCFTLHTGTNLGRNPHDLFISAHEYGR